MDTETEHPVLSLSALVEEAIKIRSEYDRADLEGLEENEHAYVLEGLGEKEKVTEFIASRQACLILLFVTAYYILSSPIGPMQRMRQYWTFSSLYQD